MFYLQLNRGSTCLFSTLLVVGVFPLCTINSRKQADSGSTQILASLGSWETSGGYCLESWVAARTWLPLNSWLVLSFPNQRRSGFLSPACNSNSRLPEREREEEEEEEEEEDEEEEEENRRVGFEEAEKTQVELC